METQKELEHLRKLATSEPNKRFGKLYRIVCQENFLEMKWNRVKENKGSKTPGVDAQTKEDIDAKTISKLSQELKGGCYRPLPVRRAYIPKGKNQRRGLGIPAIRDRIVQAAAASILEAIYEPTFCECSYGFRPQRSTIHALRHMARAYRTGATYIIEGDLVKCFDSLPHSIILNCLRKRIKDEQFIELIRRMLKAGVMEDREYKPTYSGTPQGGLVSPILMNIVLHEFDRWMKERWKANSPVTKKQQYAYANPEYDRIKRNLVRWRAQLNGRIPMGQQSREGLKLKIRQAIEERKRVPCQLPRRAIYYCRYADDYATVLCHHSKAEAQCIKEEMAKWLRENLGLTQHPEKTRITHWREQFRFLGYDVKGQRNPNGTHWLRLTVPPEAERKLKQRVKRLCSYTQIPKTDLFMSVNAQLRGWTQYYCYANNVGPRCWYLTGVVFWLTAHCLGRIHKCSIKKLMRTHYGIDPKTGKKALFVINPKGKRLFIWNKPPKWKSVLVGSLSANDSQPVIMTSWAGGHSYEQRLTVKQNYGNQCQQCGKFSENLAVHHLNRLGKKPQRKLGPSHIIQSAKEQEVLLLCPDCHRKRHPNGWSATT